jgi:hypothetical protein
MSIINTALLGKLKKSKASKINVLELDQTVAFTPSLQYHPATKDYVDSQVALSSGGTSTGTLTTYTGDGATSLYGIGSNPSSINNVNVTINGLSQTPLVDFTIFESNLTFTSVPVLDDDIVIRDNHTMTTSVTLVSNKRYYYIFTASTTVVSGIDDNGSTLNVDEQNVFLFLNGSKLVHGDDYTVNANGDSITLVAAAGIDDELEIHSLGSASLIRIKEAQELGLIHSIQATSRSVTTSVSQVSLCEIPISNFQSCKYIISAKNSAGVHMSEIMSIHDGTDVYTNEFGEIISGSSLGTFTTDINNGMMRLLVVPTSTSSTTFTVHRIGIET